MKYVLNFAHPLTKDQREEIERQVGAFFEIHQPAQFDMNASNLREQVQRLVWPTYNELGGHENVVAVIPPSLAIAAYWTALEINAGIPAIWLRRDGDTVPPRFVVGGIE